MFTLSCVFEKFYWTVLDLLIIFKKVDLIERLLHEIE